MEKKTWRAIAIVFVILFLLVGIVFLTIYNKAKEYEMKSNVCAYDICDMREGVSDSYFYEDSNDYCHCFKNGLMKSIEVVDDYLASHP